MGKEAKPSESSIGGRIVTGYERLVASTTVLSDSETWGMRLLHWGLARNTTETQREKQP